MDAERRDRRDMPAEQAAGPEPVPGDSAVSRRLLLGGAVGLAGTAFFGERPATASGALSGLGDALPLGSRSRARQAYELRMRAARLQHDLPVPEHAANGDEEELPRRIACFSKTLPHDALGEVDPGAYRLLLQALASGDPRDFERIPVGGRERLVNPQGALAFNLVGPDATQLPLPPPPRFASAEQAAEIVELYWQALARDIPFESYGQHPLVHQAAEDLSRLARFTGPKEGGRVTPATIFRGDLPGDRAGPYLSQFLWQDVTLSPLRVAQRIRTTLPGLDFLTRAEEWLANQNGALAAVSRFDETSRYIRNGRDLAEYVHRDFTYQAPLGACLIHLKMGTLPDGGNPYSHSRSQTGFATFGPPFLLRPPCAPCGSGSPRPCCPWLTPKGLRHILPIQRAMPPSREPV